MKVAISAYGGDLDAQIDPRFGRAMYLIIADTDKHEITDVVDNTDAQNAAQGAGIKAATKVARAGVEAVITGKVGPKAQAVLEKAGIRIILRPGGTVRKILEGVSGQDLSNISDAGSPDGNMERLGQNVGPGGGASQGGGGGGTGMGGSGRGRGMGRGGMGRGCGCMRKKGS